MNPNARQRRRRARRRPALVSELRVLLCARCPLFRRMAEPRAAAAQGRSPRGAAGRRGDRIRALCTHDDVRSGGLDDVADAALAFDGVRAVDRHGPGAGGARRRDCLRECAQAARVDAGLRARFHDLGNLSLALVLVWTYLALMQFLIMWIEDLPDEIGWMLLRTRTSWSSLTWFLVFAHFLVPFVLLLSRGAKRAPARSHGSARSCCSPVSPTASGSSYRFSAARIRAAVERPRRAAVRRRGLALRLDLRDRTAGGAFAAWRNGLWKR